MSVLNKEVYEAFLEAGAVDHSDLDKRLAIVETKLDAITKMMWMVIAGIIALVLKAYFVAG